MNEYVPDKWLIVKMEGKEETLYKVFACWYGGYGGSDSWQMNSGIKAVTEAEDYWLFEGYSGSIYKCRKGSYGLSNYGASILMSLTNKAKEQGLDIQTLKDTDWKAIDYEKTKLEKEILKR